MWLASGGSPHSSGALFGFCPVASQAHKGHQGVHIANFNEVAALESGVLFGLSIKMGGAVLFGVSQPMCCVLGSSTLPSILVRLPQEWLVRTALPRESTFLVARSWWQIAESWWQSYSAKQGSWSPQLHLSGMLGRHVVGTAARSVSNGPTCVVCAHRRSTCSALDMWPLSIGSQAHGCHWMGAPKPGIVFLGIARPVCTVNTTSKRWSAR